MGSMIMVIVRLLNVYSLVVLVRVLLSWLPDLDRSNPLIEFVYNVTDPVLSRIREVLPSVQGIDFSPMVLLFGISILTRLLVRMA